MASVRLYDLFTYKQAQTNFEGEIFLSILLLTPIHVFVKHLENLFLSLRINTITIVLNYKYHLLIFNIIVDVDEDILFILGTFNSIKDQV